MSNRLTVLKTILWGIVGMWAVVTVARFTNGLGATTNLSDAAPWGLWIGFDVMAGVALAAGAFLLAATVWPGYDLTAALRHVSGRLIYIHSRGDWLINGLGPLLFGTADRKHTPAAGTVGFRHRPADDVADRLFRVAYNRRFARSGYLGDHFTVASSGLARDHVAAWLTGNGPN